MSRAPAAVLALLAAVAPLAQPAPAAPAEHALPLSLIGPDYKRPIEVPDSFFNPFKVEATLELGDQRRGAAISEQSVAAAVLERGISGIILDGDPSRSQAIIGDQVFAVGDELAFPQGDSLVPLLAGASVTLRAVGERSLQVEFTAEGEGARRAVVSLKNFWRP